jgi:hypothetical protein
LNILGPFGIIYGLLVVVWYIFPKWYVWTKKNLATLVLGENSKYLPIKVTLLVDRQIDSEEKI